MPSFSIICPCYNASATVAETVKSVRNQSFSDWEMVLIDDGSTDDTYSRLTRYAEEDSRIKCLHQSNRGLSATRNRGIDATDAPNLIFLDSDDRLKADALQVFESTLSANLDVGLVYGPALHVDLEGRSLGSFTDHLNPQDMFDDLATGNRIAVCAVVVRRSALGANRFDETLNSCEDWDLWLKLGAGGCRWFRADEPVAELRIRPSSMSRNPKVMYDTVATVLARTRQAIRGRNTKVTEQDVMKAAAKSATHYSAMSAVRGDSDEGIARMRGAGAGDPRMLAASEAVSQASSGMHWYLCDAGPEELNKARQDIEAMFARFSEFTGRDDILVGWRNSMRQRSTAHRALDKARSIFRA